MLLNSKQKNGCLGKRISVVKLLMYVFFIFVSISCGYSTHSNLPQSLQTVYVEPFKNKIEYTTSSGRNVYFALMEVDSRNAVIDRFLFDGRLKIGEKEMADLILKGKVTGYQRSPLRYTDSDDVEEYRVHIIVSFEMWDRKENLMLWAENNFVGEATYFVIGSLASSEDVAVDEAIEDLARRIVERTIEDW